MHAGTYIAVPWFDIAIFCRVLCGRVQLTALRTADSMWTITPFQPRDKESNAANVEFIATCTCTERWGSSKIAKFFETRRSLGSYGITWACLVSSFAREQPHYIAPYHLLKCQCQLLLRYSVETHGRIYEQEHTWKPTINRPWWQATYS